VFRENRKGNKREKKEERERERGRTNERKYDTLARVCMCDCVWVCGRSDRAREKERGQCVGLREAEAVCVGGRAGGRSDGPRGRGAEGRKELNQAAWRLPSRSQFPAEASFFFPYIGMQSI